MTYQPARWRWISPVPHWIHTTGSGKQSILNAVQCRRVRRVSSALSQASEVLAGFYREELGARLDDVNVAGITMRTSHEKCLP